MAWVAAPSVQPSRQSSADVLLLPTLPACPTNDTLHDSACTTYTAHARTHARSAPLGFCDRCWNSNTPKFGARACDRTGHSVLHVLCSNPPKFGALLVTIILSDPELLAQWKVRRRRGGGMLYL